MEKKVGVLLIQGLGNSKVQEAQNIKQQLLQELELQEPGFSERIVFSDVDYHTAIQHRQERLWKRMELNGLRWGQMRRFCLHYLSDATAYQHHPAVAPNTYWETHRKIQESLHSLQVAAESEGFIPVVLAGSLGCMIINNYIWDAQKSQYLFDHAQVRAGQVQPHETLENLELMITWGCNIPLFVSSLQQVRPIVVPKYATNFQWFNYFDRDDILGWPLKPLGKAYADRVTEDIPINSGLTPLGHTKYWSKPNRMARQAAKRIVSMYKAYLNREAGQVLAA